MSFPIRKVVSQGPRKRFRGTPGSYVSIVYLECGHSIKVEDHKMRLRRRCYLCPPLSAKLCATCGNPVFHKKSVLCKSCFYTHGESRVSNITPEYRAWTYMIARCKYKTKPAYANVSVCSRWATSYTNFLADMGRKPSPTHSLDRYPDPNGNYEPGNCRWATSIQQQNNKNSNKVISFSGETLTVAEWERRKGLPHGLLRHRLYAGWPINKAINTPKLENGSWQRIPNSRPTSTAEKRRIK